MCVANPGGPKRVKQERARLHLAGGTNESIMFLVGYLISGNEVLPTYIEFGVDAGLSKFIGGMIILVYLLAGIAIGGIIYSEFSKTFKNG